MDGYGENSPQSRYVRRLWSHKDPCGSSTLSRCCPLKTMPDEYRMDLGEAARNRDW